MKVAIHQPEHLPWLGFFDKMSQADVYVVLDDVQYEKRNFQNRNQIRTKEGAQWLTVPVAVKGKFEQEIRNVEIDNAGSPRWREKSLQTFFHAYHEAPHWSKHAPFLEKIYSMEWNNLIDLNMSIIEYMREHLEINTPIKRSSELGVMSAKSQRILDICTKIGATAYLSGQGAKTYLDTDAFSAAGIAVEFQEFKHPVYKQLHEPFLPNMSAIDFLLCADKP